MFCSLIAGERLCHNGESIKKKRKEEKKTHLPAQMMGFGVSFNWFTLFLCVRSTNLKQSGCKYSGHTGQLLYSSMISFEQSFFLFYCSPRFFQYVSIVYVFGLKKRKKKQRSAAVCLPTVFGVTAHIFGASHCNVL